MRIIYDYPNQLWFAKYSALRPLPGRHGGASMTSRQAQCLAACHRRTTMFTRRATAFLFAPIFALWALPAAAAEAYFIGLSDGAVVASPVTIRFGLTGMGVAPAGIEKDGTGHHHVLVDRAVWGAGPDDAAIAENGLPSDDHHRHFGGGQTETVLELSPGPHTLQLVMGDAYHVPLKPSVASGQITVIVE
jgi:hypothetical protein